MAEAVTARLEAVTARLEKLASKLGRGGGGGDDDDEVEAIYVGEFQAIIDTQLSAVVKSLDACKIKDMGKYLTDSYNNVLQLIRLFNKCKKPSGQELLGFLSTVSESISKADKLAFKGKNKKDLKKNMDAYKALKESITLCAWPTVAPPAGLPLQHIDTQSGAADFNLNRVLKNTKDDNYKNMVKTVKVLNKAVSEFVKNNFKKGIDWKIGGSELPKAGEIPVKSVKKEENKEEQKDAAKDNKKKEKKAGGGVGALFGEINKGTGITKGLNKVKKSQKNKYKKVKVSGKVNVSAKKSSRKKFGAATSALKGGRWIAENHDEGVVTIDKATLKNQVYIAVGDNTTYDVKGKIKSLTIDNCRKCRVFVDEVVSVIELVNCKSVLVVCRDTVKSITIDRSESVSIRLEKKAFECNPDIYTSNITATNIETPDVNNDKEFKEYPIPEQFLFKIDPKTGKYRIEATEH